MFGQALKETLAAGKASPQRRALGSFSAGSRSPGGDSGQDEINLPSSPASVVSIGSVGSEARCNCNPLSSSLVGVGTVFFHGWVLGGWLF